MALPWWFPIAKLIDFPKAVFQCCNEFAVIESCNYASSASSSKACLDKWLSIWEWICKASLSFILVIGIYCMLMSNAMHMYYILFMYSFIFFGKSGYEFNPCQLLIVVYVPECEIFLSIQSIEPLSGFYWYVYPH